MTAALPHLKRLLALLLFSVLATRLAFAQESAPSGTGLDLIPAAPGQQINPDAELPLIPDIPESVRKPAREVTQRPNSKTAAADDALQERIRMRAAKTKALRDPAVQAEWEKAQAAPTDYEKREGLKSYYRALYSRMLRIDGSLKAPIEESKKRALARLEQTRIAPTVPPEAARASR